MKNALQYLFIIVITVALWASPSSIRAQMLEEDGTKAIAGVLVPITQEYVQWTFHSSGDEIIFANLDADAYLEAMEGHETETAASEGGGCSDEEGGPGVFYIEIREQNDTVICRADRPSPPPGWMRDPRLACKLPLTRGQKRYYLRVGLNESLGENPQEYYPFVLNVSLRGIAQADTTIQSAVGRSINRF